ncbi:MULTISPECIES: GntR family transcriptional regulator [unclassified Rathayibacter]|uniref:GntR family transcriptional regulator n=1 Tax=unclassified Rathayibacter TaxID=2609250 RepID=UPI0007011E9F|nr:MULTISPECIES: GntR family transcriptional regulator [unclassified Rathayibacter]KQQ06044.1 GntR family transcriptional regulator [Rathayibacter sp. Leaf294]KQS13901.1 GntR family transcriptional regulator [Rathayibacter sp. Leaf185]
MPIPRTTAVTPRSLLRDDVYQALRDAIVDGTFEPGERLRDQELETWLGVSRTPIREALLRLARVGLVSAKPGRATIVTPSTSKSVSDAQQIAASMHELATRLAGPSITPDALAEMETANADFARALDGGDVELALRSDDAFHGVLTGLSGNPMIDDVLEQATPLIRRAERLRFASLAARESVEQHRAIVARLRDGDVDGAARLGRENWMTLDRHLHVEEDE